MRAVLALLTPLTWLLMSFPLRAADPLEDITQQVNAKLVKLFGAGGFRGIANYGTGILISPDGHILTAAAPMLDSAEIVVHLADGVKLKAQVLVVEPLLDVALLKIRVEGRALDEPTGLNLPHFNFQECLKLPPAQAGDWVLALSNQFEIAMRDEPMTVQRGVVAAFTKMTGRRGIFDFPYDGPVYVLDAITNNPGAAGGALVNLRGELLGIVGKEIKNTLSETWMNYAIPLTASVQVRDGDRVETVTLAQFVELGLQGRYKPVKRPVVELGLGGYHGIRFVPNVLERTPPYVEEVDRNSPAHKAGVRIGDLISFIDGEPIYSIRAFHDYLRKTRPGMRIRLEVRRDDLLQTIELDLVEHPAKPSP